MLEIDILRNFSQKQSGCPEGCFLRVWVSKRRPHALLAKTMLHSVDLLFPLATTMPVGDN